MKTLHNCGLSKAPVERFAEIADAEYGITPNIASGKPENGRSKGLGDFNYETVKRELHLQIDFKWKLQCTEVAPSERLAALLANINQLWLFLDEKVRRVGLGAILIEVVAKNGAAKIWTDLKLIVSKVSGWIDHIIGPRTGYISPFCSPCGYRRLETSRGPAQDDVADARLSR